LLTTHELEEAERLADVLYLIDKGRLVASGTLDQLAALAGPPELRWQSAPRLETASLSALLGAAVREEKPGSYVAGVEGNPETVGSLAAWLAERGLPLAGLRAGRAPLEDLYLRLTAAAPAAPEEPEGRATLGRTAEEAASKGPAAGEGPPGKIEEQA